MPASEKALIADYISARMKELVQVAQIETVKLRDLPVSQETVDAVLEARLGAVLFPADLNAE
jgi:hypothetical protein